MKKTSKYLLILIPLVMLAGIGIGYLIFGGESITSGETHNHTQTTVEEVWTCAMHPQIRQNEPGNCPICGMELVPVDDSGDGELGANQLRMSEEAMKLAAVQTTLVTTRIASKEISLLGKVKPDERLIAAQTAHFPGRIERLYVNFLGQKVAKGQRIASVFSPELVTAQKELLEALRHEDTNPMLLKAARNKLKNWLLMDEQIAAIEASGKVRTEIDIHSHYNGYVSKLNVAVGDHLMNGHVIMEITGLAKVWVLFEVYERDLAWVRIKDQLTFTVQSLPGREFVGTVTFIDPVVNPRTRVLNVRAEVANPGELLKPDMFAAAVLKTEMKSLGSSLMIPKSAVLWTGKRAVVYVKSPDVQEPTFEYREIVLGPDAGDHYVVKEGLAEGEEVVSNGLFRIDAAAQLQGKKSMMNPEGGKTSTGHDHAGMDMKEQENETSEEAEREANREAHLEFMVAGNCAMCKARIEGALKGVTGVYSAVWNVESKKIHVKYDPKKIAEMEIHKKIAAAGHDTDKVKGDQSTYDDLPGCCQYSRE